MKLLLVRHGESRGNQKRQWQGWLDEPLTERGQEQAYRLSERLVRWFEENPEPISAVYSSTLTRAFQTAHILAQRWCVPLVLDGRLRERDIGVLQGLTWSDVEQRYPEVAQHIRQRWTVPALPDGETTEQLTKRVVGAIDEIVARANGNGIGDAVVVVSHGGSINAYLNRLVGRNHEMPFIFRLGNTSLSVVELNDGRPRISLVNDVCHLH
jgi:broad specificity phosphatase PhoE